jgi:exopolysaccharide production protein ExoY
MNLAGKASSGYQERRLSAQPVAVETLFIAENDHCARNWNWKLVQLFERVAAAVLLLSILPLLIFAGFVVAVLSGANPLIAHGRVGLRGTPFWVLKLRTMWEPGRQCAVRGFIIERISDYAGPSKKRERDPRVTSRFAAFCRRFSIDEAPQLWQVVRGDMALIGPRPLTERELIENYGAAAPEVLRLRPGLTGLWQVRGRNRLSYRQRLRLDLFLVRKWSFGLYMNILLTTVPKVLLGKDAW